jgi:hypothetical protein
MLDRVLVGGMLRVAAAALVLSLATAPSAFAKGGPDNGKGHDDDHRSIPNCSRHDDDRDDDGRDGDNHLTCPNKQVLVRTDEKTCPDKPGRPAVVRKRACCRHGNLTNCHPFRPCPPRSRS